MAVLQLDRVWVNRMDTGEAVSAFSMDRSQQHSVDGEVRTYAGGRQRSVSKAGLRGRFAVTLRQLSTAQKDTLISWIGLHVQVRDKRGQRFFGTFFSVTPIERPEPTLYDAAIEVQTVTVEEGV